MKTQKLIPTIKTPSGKVIKPESPSAHHKDIKARGKKGFVTLDDAFKTRTDVVKVAKAVKQLKPAAKSVKVLHSHNLKGR